MPHSQKPQAQPSSSRGTARHHGEAGHSHHPDPAAAWQRCWLQTAPQQGRHQKPPARHVLLNHSLAQLPQLPCIWGIPSFPPDPAAFPKGTAELPGSQHSPDVPASPGAALLTWAHPPVPGCPGLLLLGPRPRLSPSARPLCRFLRGDKSLVRKRLQLCLLEDEALAPAGAPNPHHRSLQAAKRSGESRPCF